MVSLVFYLVALLQSGLLQSALGYEDVRQIFINRRKKLNENSLESGEADCIKDLQYFFDKLEQREKWAEKSKYPYKLPILAILYSVFLLQ